jgi:hypothetical protein
MNIHVCVCVLPNIHSLANKLDLPDVERTRAIAWYSWLDVPMTGMYEIELIGT